MVAFHSVVDFPLRSPGIVATLALLCAILYRLAVLERKKPRRASAPNGQRAGTANSASFRRIAEKTGVVVKPARGAAILGGVLCMAIFFGWMYVCQAAMNELQGQIEGARIARATRRLTPYTPNTRQFAEASLRSIKSHSPMNADLRADLADFARRAVETLENPTERLVMAETALELRQDAAALEPSNAEHRFDIASDYLALGRPELAWRNARLAADLMPTDPYIRADIADMFFAAGLDSQAFVMLDEADKLARARNLNDARRRIANVRRRRVNGSVER